MISQSIFKSSSFNDSWSPPVPPEKHLTAPKKLFWPSSPPIENNEWFLILIKLIIKECNISFMEWDHLFIIKTVNNSNWPFQFPVNHLLPVLMFHRIRVLCFQQNFSDNNVSSSDVLVNRIIQKWTEPRTYRWNVKFWGSFSCTYYHNHKQYHPLDGRGHFWTLFLRRKV